MENDTVYCVMRFNEDTHLYNVKSIHKTLQGAAEHINEYVNAKVLESIQWTFSYRLRLEFQKNNPAPILPDTKPKFNHALNPSLDKEAYVQYQKEHEVKVHKWNDTVYSKYSDELREYNRRSNEFVEKMQCIFDEHVAFTTIEEKIKIARDYYIKFTIDEEKVLD